MQCTADNCDESAEFRHGKQIVCIDGNLCGKLAFIRIYKMCQRQPCKQVKWKFRELCALVVKQPASTRSVKVIVILVFQHFTDLLRSQSSTNDQRQTVLNELICRCQWIWRPFQHVRRNIFGCERESVRRHKNIRITFVKNKTVKKRFTSHGICRTSD